MPQPLIMIKPQGPSDIFPDCADKMQCAVHRHTAAELIVERADMEKEDMGVTIWESVNMHIGVAILLHIRIPPQYCRNN